MYRHAQCGPLRKSKLILFEIEIIENGIQNCDESSFLSPVLIFLATTNKKSCIVAQSIWLSKHVGDQQIDHFFRDRPLEKCWGGGGGDLKRSNIFFFKVIIKNFFVDLGQKL